MSIDRGMDEGVVGADTRTHTQEYYSAIKKNEIRTLPNTIPRASLVAQLVKNLPTMRETWV